MLTKHLSEFAAKQAGFVEIMGLAILKNPTNLQPKRHITKKLNEF
jgi:hypothetical protein